MNNVPKYIQDQGEEATSDFLNRFPIFKTPYDTASVITDKRIVKKSSGQSVIQDGTIRLNETTGLYEGYFDGEVVSECNSSEKVKNRLAAHYNVVEFFGEAA